MSLDTAIKIANYKCFGPIGQGFDKIFPINIIIGKNNSGKSSLIDLLEFVNKPNQDFLKKGRERQSVEVTINDQIQEEFINTYFRHDQNSGSHVYNNDHLFGLTLVGKPFEYTLSGNNNTAMISPQNIFPDQFVHMGNKAAEVSYNKLSINSNIKTFKRINAERNILPETKAGPLAPEIESNGNGATGFIRKVINKNIYNADLIQKDLLIALNEILAPDIHFTWITIQEEAEGDIWEVYLKENDTELIPLSKMGSGIKTVILVLLYLIAMPVVEKKSLNDYVFCFEELENNLHPSLLRRLFGYIIKYAQANNSVFFITTHSSIVIDLFGSNQNAQLVHVVKNGNTSLVSSVNANSHSRKILKDLDVRPSDLLLSNGVIWVEGPSDAIYLECLLGLYTKQFKGEDSMNLSYSIQSLAPSLWKHAGFDYKKLDFNDTNFSNRVITLANINHNHVLIIDRDDNYENRKPSEWQSFENGTGRNKAKLIFELMKFANHDETNLESDSGDTKSGTLFFWITEGTFETYLKHFIENKGRSQFQPYFDFSSKRGYFEKKRADGLHSKSKVELAFEISQFSNEEGILFTDLAPEGSELYNKIERLYNTIILWN